MYLVPGQEVQEVYYCWDLFPLFKDFRIKLGVAGDHRNIAS